MPVELPDPLRRREILYGNTAKEQLLEYGLAYEEVGRIDDALQFYIQAADRPAVGRIKNKAMETADAFLMKAVARAFPDMVESGDWRLLAASAEKLGKELYAEQARKALEGHLEALEPEEKRGQGKS